MWNRLCNVFLLIVLMIPAYGQSHSVARQWNEVLLTAIRNDLARPTVHARNLFHHSAAMYDAWAVYDEEAQTYFLRNTFDGFTFEFYPYRSFANIEEKRAEAISYVSYRLIRHRFQNSPGVDVINHNVDSLMNLLGYDPAITSIDYQDRSPATLGNYIANRVIAFGLQDNSNEQNDYENLYYKPVNGSLVPRSRGIDSISDPNRWQPLRFETFIDQSGNIIEGGLPDFLSPEWGWVTPFSLTDDDAVIKDRDGFEYKLFHDPGAPAYLDTTENNASSQFYRWNHQLVTVWSSHLTSEDTTRMDISPASLGNIDLTSLPNTFEEYQQFYDLLNGGDPGTGYEVNPATQAPYEPQYVKRGDYARILAEFWADGPDSETPPGHWYTILNYVSDHPELEKRMKGEGEILGELEWDVKSYFLLGGAMHDAAIAAWSIKGYYDYIRPISALRYMASLGQSSDPTMDNYHPAGVSLIPGFIEVIEEGDPLQGFSRENIGKIKFKAWRGHSVIPFPEDFYAGVDWILAAEWNPYQRQTFVTPPFAGYVSGHSTYSRAAAEVMTLLTGDAYFPGGMGIFPAPQNEFLVFEDGPSEYVELQWATYRDASDQCSLSRIWGGIHPPIDDIPGRRIGYQVGLDAFTYGVEYFEGKELIPLASDYDIKSDFLYPNPAIERLIIEGVEFETLFVYNLNGQQEFLPMERVGEDIVIDVSNLTEGYYLIQDSKSNSTYKFYKK